MYSKTNDVFSCNTQGIGADGPAPVHFEPQVAVLCDAKSDTPYYSQYMSENGRWTSDTKRKVGCLKEKVDILDYCKKVSISHRYFRKIPSVDT
jgi:amyloid beta A4 protein